MAKVHGVCGRSSELDKLWTDYKTGKIGGAMVSRFIITMLKNLDFIL